MNTVIDRSLLQGALPIGECGVLASDHPDSTDDVIRTSTVCRYSQHETIFFEGDQAETICQVVEGAVMLYKLLPDGRRQVVELLGPGDVFGFARGEFRDSSAETLSATRTRFFDRKRAQKSCSFQRVIANQMLSQLEAMHDHAMLLGRMSAMERVARYLLKLAGHVAGDVEEPSIIRLAMTRQEIADYLGLTIETVSRSFSELRRRGVIVLEKQDRVRIANQRAMEDLAIAC
jgi:CRP-like cAMP-binding protein